MTLALALWLRRLSEAERKVNSTENRDWPLQHVAYGGWSTAFRLMRISRPLGLIAKNLPHSLQIQRQTEATFLSLRIPNIVAFELSKDLKISIARGPEGSYPSSRG